MSKIQYLGSGIEVIHYPTFEKLFPDHPELKFVWITPEAEAAVNQLSESIRENRGKFISGCIDIENLLSRVISYFFFDKDSEKREIFHIFILDATTLSFKQKETLLRLLMEKYPEKFDSIIDKKRQELIRTLDELIKKRNAFAHGKIVIDYQAQETVLIFYDRSKNRSDKLILSSTQFSELHEKIVNVCEILLALFPSECATSTEYGGVRIDRGSLKSNKE